MGPCPELADSCAASAVAIILPMGFPRLNPEWGLCTAASTGSFGSLHGAAAVHHQPALAAGGSGRGLGQFQRAGSGSLRGGTGYLVCGGPLPPSGAAVVQRSCSDGCGL